MSTKMFWLVAGLMSLSGPTALLAAPHRASSPRLSFRIDAGRSRLVVETHTTGLSSMFGHDHEIAPREFSGVVSFIPGAPETASLDVTVRASSLALLDKDVSERDRRDIERMIRKAVESPKQNQIAFHSTGATAEPIGPDIYQVQVTGELRLHGVRNELTVSAQVIVQANEVHIRGACKVRQSDYGIAPISFAKGTVAVADEVTVTFDLVAPLNPERNEP